MAADTNSRSSAPLLLLILVGFGGLLVGGAISTAIFMAIMSYQEKRHQAEMAELAAAGVAVEPAKALLKSVYNDSFPQANSSNKTAGDPETKVMTLGKEFIDDLENLRFTSAYRSTSPAYQKTMERKAFEEMVNEFPDIKRLDPTPSCRQIKVRKTPDGKDVEFYCTAHSTVTKEGSFVSQGLGSGPKMNFFMIWSPEGDAWRLSELELTAENHVPGKAEKN